MMGLEDLPCGQQSPHTGKTELHSLQCVVTVTCKKHGSHTAIVEGPFQKVMDVVGLFRETAEVKGRWTLTTFMVLDELVPELWISEWD